jgi:class 3 adenylate cyclase
MGDAFMASFGSVTKAVECAVALQQAFAAREGEPLYSVTHVNRYTVVHMVVRGVSYVQ